MWALGLCRKRMDYRLDRDSYIWIPLADIPFETAKCESATAVRFQVDYGIIGVYKTFMVDNIYVKFSKPAKPHTLIITVERDTFRINLERYGIGREFPLQLMVISQYFWKEGERIEAVERISFEIIYSGDSEPERICSSVRILAAFGKGSQLSGMVVDGVRKTLEYVTTDKIARVTVERQSAGTGPVRVGPFTKIIDNKLFPKNFYVTEIAAENPSDEILFDCGNNTIRVLGECKIHCNIFDLQFARFMVECKSPVYFTGRIGPDRVNSGNMCGFFGVERTRCTKNVGEKIVITSKRSEMIRYIELSPGKLISEKCGEIRFHVLNDSGNPIESANYTLKTADCVGTGWISTVCGLNDKMRDSVIIPFSSEPAAEIPYAFFDTENFGLSIELPGLGETEIEIKYHYLDIFYYDCM